MGIVLHTRASRAFVEQVEDVFGSGVVTIIDDEDKPGLAEALKTADVLLHVLVPVTADMIAGAPKLKLIQKIGVGVNTIDIEAAKAKGVAVCNMPGTNSQAVAEQALALMLAVLRRTHGFNSRTRAGRGWDENTDLKDSCGEISGRTVGLVGMGNSAQRLARALDALGAEVIYAEQQPRPELPYACVPLPELLRRADILSLHVPLTPETDRMIGAAALASLPAGAVLINTARGELIDEAALVAALENGHLRGAGLDVFDREPVDPRNPLLRLDQVVVTPHVSWLTPETLNRSMKVAAENARRVRSGDDLLHRVA